MKIVLRCALLLVLLLIPYTLYAQATTGNIIGTVTSQGKPLSGVTVTVASPSLQGTRTAISGEAGGYNFPSLPPGDYTASFELSGMQAARKRVTVDVSTTSRADIEMKLSSVSEAISVTAATAPAAESTQVTTNRWTPSTHCRCSIGPSIRSRCSRRE